MTDRNRQPVAVVMTATISPPPNTPNLARSDPFVRLEDYKEALRFYLRLPSDCVDRVVFIDNSDSDLSPLETIVSSEAGGKRVELIAFEGNDHPPEYGKGYGEFRLLDYGLDRTSLIRGDDVFWKVTGRLRVVNLPQLIRSQPNGSALYCDLRYVPFIGNLLGGNRWMDLRVFSSTGAVYDEIMRGRYPLLRADLYDSPEVFFYDAVRALESLPVTPRFRVQPVIAGFGGHLNVDYQRGGYAVKNVVRRIARRVLPWLWL